MLVLDANILVRAVLGSKVLSLLRKYAMRAGFLAPSIAFEEAREHLPEILTARGIAVAPALDLLDRLAGFVQIVAPETYVPYERISRARLRRRDEDDWAVLAVALAFDCAIWTEDTDFFGCGVATWTSDRVELYLARTSEPEV